MAPPNADAHKKDEKKEAPADQAPAFGAPRKDTRGFALIIRTGPHEFVVAGSGCSHAFIESSTWDNRRSLG